MKEKTFLFENTSHRNLFKLSKKKLITENTLDATLSRGDNEIEVEVSYDSVPAERGHRDKYGAQEEPDYPASIEIIEVVDKATGLEIELTPDEESKLIDEINDTLADNYDDYQEPEYNYDPRDDIEYDR